MPGRPVKPLQYAASCRLQAAVLLRFQEIRIIQGLLSRANSGEAVRHELASSLQYSSTDRRTVSCAVLGRHDPGCANQKQNTADCVVETCERIAFPETKHRDGC
jgi:hypothetical protein